MMIKFHCHECMKKLAAPPDKAGRTAQCSCGATVEVPDRPLTTYIAKKGIVPDLLDDDPHIYELSAEDKGRIMAEEKWRVIGREMIAGYEKDYDKVNPALTLAILAVVFCPLLVGPAAVVFSMLARGARECLNFEKAYSYSLVVKGLFWVALYTGAVFWTAVFFFFVGWPG